MEASERIKYLGGSDISVILGISQYKTPLELWEEKRQVFSSNTLKLEESNSKEKRAGNYLEPVVAEMFADQTGLRPRVKTKEFRHKKYPFLVGHIDRAITGTNTFLECKTAAQFVADKWGETGSQIIPSYYLTQCHFYAGLMGAKEFYVAVLIGGNDFRHYKIQFRRDFFDFMVDRAVKFWGMVQKGIMPEPSTVQEINRIFTNCNKEAVQAIPEIEAAAYRLGEIRTLEKELKAEKETLQLQVKSFMKENQILLGGEGQKLAKWNRTEKSSTFTIDKQL